MWKLALRTSLFASISFMSIKSLSCSGTWVGVIACSLYWLFIFWTVETNFLPKNLNRYKYFYTVHENQDAIATHSASRQSILLYTLNSSSTLVPHIQIKCEYFRLGNPSVAYPQLQHICLNVFFLVQIVVSFYLRQVLVLRNQTRNGKYHAMSWLLLSRQR